LLVEMQAAVADPAHDRDIETLHARRAEVGQAANMALKGDLDPESRRHVHELLEICERVLRRRRVLGG
jgi:hypothetical protein